MNETTTPASLSGQRLVDFKRIVEGYLLCIVCLCGLLGNALTCTILSSRFMRTSITNIYIFALSCASSCVLHRLSVDTWHSINVRCRDLLSAHLYASLSHPCHLYSHSDLSNSDCCTRSIHSYLFASRWTTMEKSTASPADHRGHLCVLYYLLYSVLVRIHARGSERNEDHFGLENRIESSLSIAHAAILVFCLCFSSSFDDYSHL